MNRAYPTTASDTEGENTYTPPGGSDTGSALTGAGLPAVSYPEATLYVSIDHDVYADATNDPGSANAKALVEYSTNGGGAWATLTGSSVSLTDVNEVPPAGPLSDSLTTVVSKDVSGTAFNQVQVRNYTEGTVSGALNESRATARIVTWYIEYRFPGGIIGA